MFHSSSGKKKYVCISIKSTCKTPFDVTSATWSLKNGNQTEASGSCEIEKKTDTETVLSALIQPMIKGAMYTLEFDYEIPPEIFRYNILVRVK